MKWKLQAQKIKELRSAKVLTQGELAQLTYSKQQQVSEWERGKHPVRASRLKHLAIALGDSAGMVDLAMTRDYQNITLTNAINEYRGHK